MHSLFSTRGILLRNKKLAISKQEAGIRISCAAVRVSS